MLFLSFILEIRWNKKTRFDKFELYDVTDDGVEVSSYCREIKGCGILHIHLI